MKNINNTSSLGNDLFAFDIDYNDPTNFGANENPRALFNGNISQVQWKTAGANTTGNPVSERYSYSYDALNRITSATDNTGNYSLENVSYYKNGNIHRLKRWGPTILHQYGDEFGLIDNLQYTYESGNQLYGVQDFAVKDDDFGFHDVYNYANPDYLYDPNGNMTSDLNKGISSVEYNHLNMPTKITVTGTNSGTLDYVYDATGVKVRKINSNGTTTDYIGGYIYENNNLVQFFHPEGYVEPDGSGGYSYVYQYIDHLGNVRLSYSDLDNNGSIDASSEILQERNYYPFGLEHKGYNNAINGVENNYMNYNGKELEEDLGLDWIDYGARRYMRDLGRWTTIDPLGDISPDQSPFVFAFNSPLMFIDPDGAYPWPVHIRSFISSPTTGGGLFGGDGRGASTQSSPNARSRVETSFTVDPAQGTVTNPISRSDATVFYGTPSAGPTTPSLPPMVEIPEPSSSITNVSTSDNSLSLDFAHSAKDPVTPDLFTPDLDVQANLNITEDLENGVLNVTGNFTGDAFPSTEAFITDQSGETRLLLGAHKEQGGLLNLFGENKRPTFSVNMQVNIDSNGNFTGVTQGDKTYTVQEWNKRVQDAFNNQ